MSGIYGVVSRKEIDRSLYKGLEIWNNNYGDLEARSFESGNAFIGIKPEYLKDTTDDKRVFSENDKIGVFDALIFSEKNSDDTDELFLYKTVKEQGVSGVKEFNGDFAGALYDIKKNKLTLFRDHLGVRPLFYYADKERIIFSTDMRGILAVEDVDASVDERWLFEKLVGGTTMTATGTEYANIHCVPFGGSVTFDLSGQEIKKTEDRYYIPGTKKFRLKNREEYTKEMRRLIEDAVKIRAEATSQPLGAELSGGLDSGVIDLLLAKMNKKCLYFSWTPSEEELALADKDERLIIKDICEKAGITCNFGGLNISFDENSLMYKRTPLEEGEYKNISFCVRYAFPVYANTTPIFKTASFMRENGVKFIFSGHGGDEGVSHRSNPYELWYNHEYYRYLRLMYSRSSIDKHRIKKTISLIKENRKTANTVLKQSFTADIFASDLASREFYKKFGDSAIEPLSFAYDPIKYVRGGGSRNRLDVLAYYSSCTGVRYLVPYLDYRVLDYALGIPRYLYHNWYINRFIFREAFKDLMPDSMYKQMAKEEASYTNLPKEEPTEEERTDEELVKLRSDLVKFLDRKLWQQYLDFDLIEKWVRGENDPDTDAQIYRGIMSCIQVEHLVKRSREVNKKM